MRLMPLNLVADKRGKKFVRQNVEFWITKNEVLDNKTHRFVIQKF